MDKMENSFLEILNNIAKLDRRALAKGITMIERDPTLSQHVTKHIKNNRNKAEIAIIGVTGSPGVGKSTFINELASRYRQRDQTIAILATDPTSPFSGGAILGDRIRMTEHDTDKNVFIRSLGSRGSSEGLSAAIPAIIDLLRIYGVGYCIIETVGSGQLDVLVRAFADTTILLLSPEGGDEVQMMKAGIIEIADILVINKCDRNGADPLQNQLRAWLDLLPGLVNWRSPILKTESRSGQGIDEVMTELDAHQKFIKTLDPDSIDFQDRQRMNALHIAISLYRIKCLDLLQTEFFQNHFSKNGQDPMKIVELLNQKFCQERNS
jgi:LAO/AO transport system kinase